MVIFLAVIGVITIFGGGLALAFHFEDLDEQRNHTVFQIRCEWIDEGDIRHDLFTYEEMYEKNKWNKYGWKVLESEDYCWRQVSPWS